MSGTVLRFVRVVLRQLFRFRQTLRVYQLPTPPVKKRVSAMVAFALGAEANGEVASSLLYVSQFTSPKGRLQSASKNSRGIFLPSKGTSRSSARPQSRIKQNYYAITPLYILFKRGCQGPEPLASSSLWGRSEALPGPTSLNLNSGASF